MKIGKISESALKRSVLKEITYKKKNVLKKAAIGQDASVVKLGSTVAAQTIATYSGAVDIATKRAFYSATNGLYAKGAKVQTIMVSFYLPESAKESEVRLSMVWLNEKGKELDIQISGGHTETGKNMTEAVVTVTALGEVAENAIANQDEKVEPGMDIVMAGAIALEGTSVLAYDKETELKERFTSRYVEDAKVYIEDLSMKNVSEIAVKNGAIFMHDVSKGGVFAALYELSEATKLGVEINIGDIPVKQNAIEISEYLDLNPYMLPSQGAFLIVTEKAEELVNSLSEAGFIANIIGHTIEGHDKIVYYADEKRFLEFHRPGKKEDEI